MKPLLLFLLSFAAPQAMAQDAEPVAEPAPEPEAPDAPPTDPGPDGEPSPEADEAPQPGPDPEPPQTVRGARGAPSPVPAASPTEPPLAIPAHPVDREARAQAIRQYRTQFLEVRGWSELRASYTDVGFNYGYGYPYGGWGYGPYGGMVLSRPWFWQEQRWAVFRGPQRLDNLQYLRVIDQLDEKADLERRIRRNRTVGTTFYGVAVAGGVATVASLVGMDNALTARTWNDWRAVQIGGLSAVFGGVIAGSIPSGKARRLQTDFTAIRDWDTLQAEMLDHNDALRRELDLSAEDALKVESRDR